jgi:hypothetical protein
MRELEVAAAVITLGGMRPRRGAGMAASSAPDEARRAGDGLFAQATREL